MNRPLRIALLSYEFPPETAYGGIGTYTWQMSHCLQRLGCRVEVFAGSVNQTLLAQMLPNGIVVHRILGEKRETFRAKLGAVVASRHATHPFDIIEGPEYGAEGFEVRKVLPHIPFVVKFHIPTFLVKELHYDLKKHRPKYRLKRILGIGNYKREKDIEFKTAKEADAWVAPSHSMAQIMAERWSIPLHQIAVLPNPYLPPEAFTNIPVDTHTNTVTYLGRLEARKGVHLLAKAIPAVLSKHPQTLFRFIGKTNVGPNGRGTMLHYLQKELEPFGSNIEFIDNVPPAEVPQWLAQTDVCVFNSLWESFGYVCLEAMAAARGIVASQNGGMYEMLHDVKGGVLVDPLDVAALQHAIIYLLEHPQERMEMGGRSRQKVLDYYADEVPRQHLQFYLSVIEQKTNRSKNI